MLTSDIEAIRPQCDLQPHLVQKPYFTDEAKFGLKQNQKLPVLPGLANGKARAGNQCGALFTPLNKFKSPDLDKSRPRLFKELSEPLSITIEKAWRMGGLLTDKRRTKLSPFSKGGKGHIIKTISQSA